MMLMIVEKRERIYKISDTIAGHELPPFSATFSFFLNIPGLVKDRRIQPKG